MSNKALAYILIILVVVLAGGFALWRLTANKTPQPVNDNSQQLQSAQQNQTTPNQVSQDNQPQPDNQEPGLNTQPSSTPAVTDASCQRDFNENTLKTAKVNIANRQVQINFSC